MFRLEAAVIVCEGGGVLSVITVTFNASPGGPPCFCKSLLEGCFILAMVYIITYISTGFAHVRASIIGVDVALSSQFNLQNPSDSLSKLRCPYSRFKCHDNKTEAYALSLSPLVRPLRHLSLLLNGHLRPQYSYFSTD